LKIIRTSEPQPAKRISGLYMGDAYTGKTYNICTWPNLAIACFDPHYDTAAKFPDVSVIELKTWGDFEDKVLPHVKNRNLSKWLGRKVNTFAVDTLSVGSQRLSEDLQGTKERLSRPDFGRLLSKLTSAVVDCTDATAITDNAESYHVMFTAHTQTITQGEGEAMRVIGIRPAIQGQFRDLLPRLTSFAFVCQRTLESVHQANKPATSVPAYRVLTAAPNDKYICGDRVGGGRFKTLPPVCAGTYEELMNLWGIPLEPIDPPK
jgi:hypothetical protein